MQFDRRAFLMAASAAGVWPIGQLIAAEAPSMSAAIAERIVALRTTPPPPAVVERVCWTVLDNIASMVHALGRADAVRVARLLAAAKGGPAATAFGLTGRVAAVSAASANAFLLHAAEIDDSDLRAQLRASAVIMPAALAAAEIADVSGMDFVRAVALGYTLQGRLAALLGPLQPAGWMSSGVWGPPAAAATAALLLGLPAAEIASAIGLAGASSGGLFQYYLDQTEEKRLIVARGARVAVESALLAQLGEHGAAHVLDGPMGLYRRFGDGKAPVPGIAAMTEGLDRMEGPLFVYPKFYAASHSIIPTLDGLNADLPRDFDPSKVARWTVRGDAGYAVALGAKVNAFTPPVNAIGAMLSFSFVLALYLLRRSALPEDFTPAAFQDPAILALARRGRFEQMTTPLVLELELELTDGTRLRSVSRTPAPTDPAPLSAEERLRKVERLTGQRLSPAARRALIAHCRALPQARSMRAWTAKANRLIGPA